MFIVGINGSPNKEGNTKFLLRKVMEKAQSLGANTAIIDVSEVLASAKHSFCNACSNPCSGVCFGGTKLEEAYDLMKKADGLIIGSPVYFGTVSGQLKAFFDKARKLRGEKALYNKIAAGIAVGASRFGGQENTLTAINDIVLVQGMIIVGAGYIDDDCGHHGVCGQKPAEDDEFAIKRAEILAKRMVEVCRATQAIR